MDETRDPRRLKYLVVSSSKSFLEEVHGLVGSSEQVESEADSARAHERLRQARVDGLILDACLPNHAALPIAETFLTTQPRGKALLLCSDHGEATLMQLCKRDPRVELFFRPWASEEVLACLEGRSLARTR